MVTSYGAPIFKITANAQADLNLRWAHMYEGTFQTLRLK